MKKILLFLMTILGLYSLTIKNVNAKATFYEAEKIDNIWTKSVKNKTAHYQKARFYRRTSDNKPAYCVEPFLFFQEGSTYEEALNPNNISQEIWNRMSLIAHFGYGYENHQDNKWYAITQLMIWQAADKDADFYFTDKLNGNKIDAFTNEQQEINNLINSYLTKPNIDTNINIVENESIKLTDSNNVLNNYVITSPNNGIKIDNNDLIITNLKEGEYSLTLERKSELYNESSIYYYNPNSQNLMTAGNININTFNIKISVKKTSIKIIKQDKDNKSTTAKGNAKLEGTIYGIYDNQNNLIRNITINKDCEANINNLSYGTYKIKEIKAGTGYTLDNNTHEIEITPSKTELKIVLENKVIEKKFNIHKEYSDINDENKKPENNITFNIYDDNGNLYDTLTTDHNGNASIILPYGIYKIEQVNTTDGYNKIETFQVIIDEKYDETKTYSLTDYKIKVPNTYSEKINFQDSLLINIIITLFIYGQKILII